MHSDLQPDQTLNSGRYRITGRLDSGGFGVIYLATDLTLTREVAIKENQDTSQKAQHRFLREARLLAKLDHGGLPSVTDHFIEKYDPMLAGRQYLVMEFIPGEDLQKIIENKGPQDEKTVIGWMDQVMDALVYMHTRTNPDTGRIMPMIHHDIKPSNIKLTPDGKIYLVDFGLAKEEMADHSTQSTMPLSSGTQGYASPEQYREEISTDKRSDIYSLGATFYHLLTEKKPLEAPSREAGHPMYPIRKAKVSKRTARVIERAMALEPSDRYPNIPALQDDLSGKKSTPWQYVVRIAGILIAIATVINAYVDGFDQVNRAWSIAKNQLFPDTTYVNPIDGANYLHIPAGEFIMGSSDEQVDYTMELCTTYYGNCERAWFENAQPQHTVYLDSYWIMETEVTNDHYRQFMEAGGYTAKEYWSPEGWLWRDTTTEPWCWDNDYHNSDDLPVVCVSWYEAEAYTNWLSAKTELDFRLPTEAEWEKAARGIDGRLFPWGESWNGTYVNYCDKNCTYDWANESVNDGYQYTSPVGNYPKGISPYGALDMSGNVAEWVADWYAIKYSGDLSEQNPIGPERGDRRVARNGSWFNVPSDMHTSNRNRFTPDVGGSDLGFRVALSSLNF